MLVNEFPDRPYLYCEIEAVYVLIAKSVCENPDKVGAFIDNRASAVAMIRRDVKLIDGIIHECPIGIGDSARVHGRGWQVFIWVTNQHNRLADTDLFFVAE